MAVNRRFAVAPSLDKNILTINIYTIMKKNIIIPALLSILSMMMPLSASAYDFLANGIYYNITSGNTVSVTYKDTGYNSYSGSVNIPSTVSYGGVQYTVTEIGRSSFRACPNLTSVNIPNTVTTIGYAAFYNSTGFTTVNIPNSVTTIEEYGFSNCYGLTDVTIPNSVTTIGSFAFRSCSSLNEINLPNSVSDLGAQVFQGCTTLKHATLPQGITAIGAGLFYQCSALESIVIPEGVTDINIYAFYDCTSLADITIPSSTLRIDSDAFTNTAWMDNQPNGVIYAGKVALTYKGLIPQGTNLTLRSDTRSIGDGALRYQSGLVGITIPASVVYIGRICVAGCNNLTSIKVASGNSVFDSRDNCNAIVETATNTLIAGCVTSTIPTSVTAIEMYAFYDCVYLENVNLHDQITSIGEQAFLGCDLTSLNIPASVTEIGVAAFAGCENLSKITVASRNPVYDSRDNCNAIIETASNKLISGCQNSFIPNGITEIDDNAFYMHYHLTHVTIPASVTRIGVGSFQYIDDLKTVICEATTPIPITSSSFFHIAWEEGKLYVPRASINAYSNADWWSRFVDIRAIEDLVTGDIDDDGELSINDVAMLIDFLLTGNRYGLNLYNADADKDGSVDISDVSRLIDILLTQ